MTRSRDNATNVAGDISEVTAGTGLSGGGTGGAVTITNDMATTIAAKGDLVIGTGNDTYSALTVGTNNHTLIADSSTATGLTYAAGSKATLTTTGDILYASSANTPARLGIGTAGQVLKVNSGATAPEWVAAGGGMTLISTTTLSTNSVTISSIPTTYKHLYFTITNLDCSANNDFAIRFNSNTSSDYNVIDFGRSTAGTFATGGAFALNRISYSDFCSNNAQIGTGEMFIANYTNLDAHSKSITGHYMGKNTAGNEFQRFASGYYAQTSAITSITVLCFGGATFDSGTITLYGVS